MKLLFFSLFDLERLYSVPFRRITLCITELLVDSLSTPTVNGEIHQAACLVRADFPNLLERCEDGDPRYHEPREDTNVN